MALARHENFVIRGQDGSLDYQTEEVKLEKTNKGGRKRRRV